MSFKDACKLIKDLRKECQIMFQKEKTNGLDYQLRHLSETVSYYLNPMLHRNSEILFFSQ